MGSGTCDRRTRGVMASSFLAGVVCAVAVSWPTCSAPAREPFFGLADSQSDDRPARTDVRPDARPDARPDPRAPARTAPGPLKAGDLRHMAEALAVRPPERLARAPDATRSVAPVAATALPVSGETPAEEPRHPEPLAAGDVAPALSRVVTRDEESGRTRLPSERSAAPRPATPEPAGATASDPSLRLLVDRLRLARRGPTPEPAAAAPAPGPIVASPMPASTAAPPVPPVASPPPAPLPGDEWADGEVGVGGDAAPAAGDDAVTDSASEPRRRGRLADLFDDGRAAAARATAGGPATPTGPFGGRLLERLRPDRRVARTPASAEPPPPSVDAWPRPDALFAQLDALRSVSPGHGDSAAAVSAWSERSIDAVHTILATRGPRDPAADQPIIACSDLLAVGMAAADQVADPPLATQTRRAAFALARRAAVWRAAGACLRTEPQPGATPGGDVGHALASSQLAGEVAALLTALEGFETTPTVPAATAVRRSLAGVAAASGDGAQHLVRAVGDHYRAPNVRIAVHRRLTERLLPATTVNSGPLEDFILGRRVHGTRTVEQSLGVRFTPDPDEIRLELVVSGEVTSQTVTDAGPVSLHSRGAAVFTVRKPVVVSSRGLVFGSAVGTASNQSQLANVQTSFDAVPIMGSLARNIARREHDESLPEAAREVNTRIISRACREVDGRSEAELSALAERARQRVWKPLAALGIAPESASLETTADLATARLRLAAEPHLAAHTPRPRAAADALLSVQLHESTVNNVADRLDLAGRTLGLESLLRQVCGKLGFEPRIPEDLPEGVEVTFAAAQPLRVECRDGLAHVQLSLSALQSGRRSWSDIIVRVGYRPVVSGRQVLLERDGPVQITGPGHQGRMELALRTIFGKIFPRERPLPLLPASFVANPRLADVAALQAVCADGWFALALGERPVAAAGGAAAGATPPATRR